MGREVNSMYFVKLEEAVEFITVLMRMGAADDAEHFNELRIRNEEDAFIVEWIQEPYSRDYGGSFEYVPEDGYVMLERQLPDGTFEMFHSDEDYQETLKEWLQENPGWEKNEYGRWFNREENERITKELMKSVEDK